MRDYWDSAVKYQCPQEYDESLLSGDPLLRTERIENAGDVTIGEMTRQLGLEQYDRICYLYDYGDEWRFYAILKEVLSDEPSDKEPDIVKEKGDPINDQYDPPETGESDPPLPDPLYSVLPETAVPVADLRELEERDRVVHVIPLLSLETGFGAVCERFAIQFEDTGYVIENFQPGWQIVEEVDGVDKTEEELQQPLRMQCVSGTLKSRGDLWCSDGTAFRRGDCRSDACRTGSRTRTQRVRPSLRIISM